MENYKFQDKIHELLYTYIRKMRNDITYNGIHYSNNQMALMSEGLALNIKQFYMSMQHCQHCNQVIDTDYDAEHFDTCEMINEKIKQEVNEEQYV